MRRATILCGVWVKKLIFHANLQKYFFILSYWLRRRFFKAEFMILLFLFKFRNRYIQIWKLCIKIAQNIVLKVTSIHYIPNLHRHLSGSRQAVVRQSSGSPQAVFKNCFALVFKNVLNLPCSRSLEKLCLALFRFFSYIWDFLFHPSFAVLSISRIFPTMPDIFNNSLFHEFCLFIKEEYIRLVCIYWAFLFIHSWL